jgi:hypothetical protein
MTAMNGYMRTMVVILALGLSYPAFGKHVWKAPAVDVSTPNRVSDLEVDDVCGIDFRNAHISGENADWTADLKGGKYERRHDFGYESAEIEQVFCFGRKDGPGPYALVVTNWMGCGGSCMRLGVVQLFVVRGSHPVITQQFVFDSHAVGTGVSFDAKGPTLTITGRSDDGSPNCCAMTFDVVTYQWQEDKFVQQSYRRVRAPRKAQRPMADPEVPSAR